MGIGRYAVWKPLEVIVQFGSKVSAGGILVGEGRGYFSKLHDGITAFPDIIDYFPNMLKDFDRIRRIEHGFNRTANGGSNVLESVKGFKFREALERLESAYDGLGEVGKVAKEID